MRTLRSMLFLATLMFHSVMPSAAVAADFAREDEDAIFIPAGAKEVRQADFFAQSDYWLLNEHMLLTWADQRPYLLVLYECPALERQARPEIMVIFKSFRSLRAGSDLIYVRNESCVIDRIFKITRNDATALKKRFQ